MSHSAKCLAVLVVLVGVAAGGEKSKRPTVKIGDVEVNDAFERAVPEFAACYARARERKPDLECSLMFRVDIDDGQVSSVRRDDSPSSRDERLAALEILSRCTTGIPICCTRASM